METPRLAVIVADDRAYVGLLRVRGLPEGTLSARLRFSHVVGAADLQPAGMPAGATLVVRRLRDPLPGRLAHALTPGAVPSRDWERAAQATLTDCYHKATRPCEAGLSSSADAVLFGDPGELLAYLARDLSTGVAASRWWWAALLDDLPTDTVAALVAAFLHEPRSVPAALAHLSAWGDAPAVLSLFTPADAVRVFAAVVREYELVALASTLVAATAQPFIEQPAPVDGDRHEATPQVERVETGRAAAVRSPPWEPSVPRGLVPDSLSSEARALLGVCLLLHRAPAVVRQRQFAIDFSQWQNEIAATGRTVVPAGRPEPSAVTIGAVGDVVRREQAMPAPPPSRDGARLLTEPTGRAQTHQEADALSAERHLDRNGFDAPAVESQVGATTERPAPAPAPPPPLSRATTPSADSPQREEAQTPVASPPSGDQPREPLPQEPTVPRQQEEGVEAQPAPTSSATQPQGLDTELGGVLFLINLMQQLGVPRDLERDFGVAYAIGAWGWLELVARCLLDRDSPELANDPIWKPLATLDGRIAGKPPPQDFVGQLGYRLPEAWISYSGARTQGSLELRRVGLFWQLWDPVGYQVIEAADWPPTDLDSQGAIVPMAAEAEQRAERRSACRPLGWSPPEELKRFLKLLLPYIRWRLRSAMGLEEANGALAAALLVRPAHLSVTPTHVDLTMALHLATGSVRHAGLDVDPGWVPEFGRIVSFHYV